MTHEGQSFMSNHNVPTPNGRDKNTPSQDQIDDAIDRWVKTDGGQRLRTISCEALGVRPEYNATAPEGLPKHSTAELLWQALDIAGTTPIDSLMQALADDAKFLAADMLESGSVLSDDERKNAVVKIAEKIHVLKEMMRRRDDALAKALDLKGKGSAPAPHPGPAPKRPAINDGLFPSALDEQTMAPEVVSILWSVVCQAAEGGVGEAQPDGPEVARLHMSAVEAYATVKRLVAGEKGGAS